MLRSQYLLELHSVILCIVAILVYRFFQKNKDEETKLIVQVIAVNIGVLIWDMLAYSQQGVDTDLGLRMHIVSNFCLYGMEYLETYLTAKYFYRILLKYTGNDYKILTRCAAVVLSILAFLLVMNLYTGCYYYFDEANYYHRGPLFIMNVMPQIILMCICLFFVIRHSGQLPGLLFAVMLLYVLFPIAGIILQTLFFGFSFFNVAISVSVVAFCGVSAHQINRDFRKRDEILFQTQTCLMGAQMNPHFIFNALASIGYLMDEDVDTAHEALIEFSSYLRRNIEITPQQGLVTLDDEIDFTEAYVYIEKLRFGDAIEVDFDIEDSGIMVPYLTIEPLVENAIKHGIRKRPGKGRVLVRAWHEDGASVISVEDDGVGFDPNKLNEKGTRSRIGIANVRERIRILCNGTMKIESKPGQGTRIEIRLPEGKK